MSPLLLTLFTALAPLSSAFSISRADLLRSLAGGSFMIPFAAVADRGKDLYQSDKAVLSGGGVVNEALGDASALPKFDADGRVIDANGYSEEATTRALTQGKAFVQVSKAWVQNEDGSLSDPVTGSAASALTMTARPSPLGSISEAGKPEALSLVDALGLEKELERADLVAAAVRVADGVTFYDYDLALPARECVPELATACLPSKVVLLSCGVRSGTIHVLRVDATPDQWRRAGRSIKALRSTFSVTA